MWRSCSKADEVDGVQDGEEEKGGRSRIEKGRMRGRREKTKQKSGDETPLNIRTTLLISLSSSLRDRS